MAQDPKGLDRLTRQLAALPAVLKDAGAEALRQRGEELAQRIASACQDPVLAAQVKLEAGPAFNTEGAAIKADAGLVVHIASLKVVGEKGHVHNPTWEEFGTAAHSTAKGASRKTGKYQDRGPHHPGAHRRPYFWPTVRAWKRSMRAGITRATSKAAKTIAGK